MFSTELCRKRIINNLLKVSKIDNGEFCIYNIATNNSYQKEKIKEYLENKSDYELIKLINDHIYFEDYDTKIGDGNEKMLTDVLWMEQNISFIDVKKEIAVIKDNAQNTADVVNLFTDIDKNRNSLEEQNKQITNRLDKLENKMDNLEANISQILKLLQKN